jgi:hypothetical protein
MLYNKVKLFVISFVLGCVLLTNLTGCQKKYLDNTGVHEAKYDGTIMKYLDDKPEYFDSLAKAIRLAGMESLFSDSIVTFFAPPSQCIMASVYRLNQYLYLRGLDTVLDLKQIDSSVWRETLSEYVLRGRFVQKDFPQLDTTQLATFPGQGYTTISGEPMNVGVIFNDANGIKYAGLRKLCYSYIINPKDPAGGMINLIVSSADVQPTNGVVHVLRLHNYYFGFNPNLFILNAVSKGIAPYKIE